MKDEYDFSKAARGKYFRGDSLFVRRGPSRPVSEARLAELAAKPDDKIDMSDIPEADEAFFESAELKPPPGVAGE